MTTFVREKTLTRDFRRVGIDENDLARLASLVATNPELADDLSISVRSGDGEDVFSTSQPEFFFDPSLPRMVSEVIVSSFKHDSPLSCKVELSCDRARVVVDGKDGEGVSGLFHELARELEARELAGGWWVSKFDSLLFFFLFSIVPAVAVYSVFDIAIALVAKADPSFPDSSTHTVTAGIGWICVLGTFFVAPSWVHGVLKRAFPVVEFRGRMRDLGADIRSRLKWIATAILFPIILRAGLNAIDAFISS